MRPAAGLPLLHRAAGPAAGQEERLGVKGVGVEEAVVGAARRRSRGKCPFDGGLLEAGDADGRRAAVSDSVWHAV